MLRRASQTVIVSSAAILYPSCIGPLPGGLSDGPAGHNAGAEELPNPAFIEVTATLHDVIVPNWFERWASG